MFFLWMLLVGIYCAGKLYGVIASRFPPAFWSDVVVNILILLGPAVMDSATGKDVYRLSQSVSACSLPLLCTRGSRSPRWIAAREPSRRVTVTRCRYAPLT